MQSRSPFRSLKLLVLGISTDLGTFLDDKIRQATAISELKSKTQVLLFEQYTPTIDTSKMERLEEPLNAERRITDNVFRFMQLYVSESQIVVDLPITVLAPSDAGRLRPRGFIVDEECEFRPMQKFYSAFEISDVTADLVFVWQSLWYLQSIPTSKIYDY